MAKKARVPVRVFLCHASINKSAVRDLYLRLIEDGFLPWLDEEAILPGEDWQAAIAEAIRTSDVVVVCLSESCVTRTGFVQKEIAYALNRAEEQPEGKLYLIPAKLEDCVVPQRLSRWQWVNLFDDGGYENLVRSLNRHRRANPNPVRSLKTYRSTANNRSTTTVQDVLTTENGGVELVRIPSGTFSMGSPNSEDCRRENEGPQHEVEVQSFYISRYPVTNEEYGRFMAVNPTVNEPEQWNYHRYNQARQPVVGITWEEARLFADWAWCRLPSEAEWEYAARAGTNEPYLTGMSIDDLGGVAWWGANSGGQPHPVGEKAANRWGVYDVLGNVWEWVEDDWHFRYDGAPKDGSAWIDIPRGRYRVMRGGAWFSVPETLRVACRRYLVKRARDPCVGFRVVLSSELGG